VFLNSIAGVNLLILIPGGILGVLIKKPSSPTEDFPDQNLKIKNSFNSATYLIIVIPVIFFSSENSYQLKNNRL